MFNRIRKWFARNQKTKPIPEQSRRYEPKATEPRGTLGQSDNCHLSNATLGDMMFSGRQDTPPHSQYQNACNSVSCGGSSNSSDSGGGCD